MTRPDLKSAEVQKNIKLKKKKGEEKGNIVFEAEKILLLAFCDCLDWFMFHSGPF